MSRNSSVAYDFDRFSPQKQEQKNNVVQLPVERRQAKKQSSGAAARFLRNAAVCAVCFVMFGSLIYNEMTINELNTNIQKSSAQLERAKSEYIQLEMAAASRMTLEEIERYAIDVLGMQKLQNHQITYIRMSDKDKIEVLAKNDLSVWGEIKAWFDALFT